MAILIENMEMPKACITGKLPNYVYCPCFNACPKACGDAERPKDCLLVEVEEIKVGEIYPPDRRMYVEASE